MNPFPVSHISQRHKQPRPSCIAPEIANSLSSAIAGKRMLVPPATVILEYLSPLGCTEMNARPMMSQKLLSSLSTLSRPAQLWPNHFPGSPTLFQLDASQNILQIRTAYARELD
jgi:hypothetical protein